MNSLAVKTEEIKESIKIVRKNSFALSYNFTKKIRYVHQSMINE